MTGETCLHQGMKHLERFPEDAPIVESILIAAEMLHAKSAREVAEMLWGREISNKEWDQIGDHWDRVWTEIMRLN